MAAPSVQKQTTFVARVNLLRMIAMVGVFFHHLWNGIPGIREASAVTEWLNPLFVMGAQGVGVFNILTGFVLAWPHLGPAGKAPMSWPEFQKKRFLRIIPAYYLSLLVLVPATMAVYGISSAGWLAWNLGERLLFLQSWDYQALMSNMAAYWWLGLLAQFYLLFPLILKIFSRLGAARACLVIMAVCWGCLGLLKADVVYRADSPFGWFDYMVYFNLPARLPEFAIGMWLAAAWHRTDTPAQRPGLDPAFTRLGWAAAALFLIGMALPELPPPLGLMYNTARCLTLVYVVFALPQTDRWGEFRPVEFIATSSYAIYLIHQPIQGFLHEALKNFSPVVEFFILTIVSGALVAVLAVLLDMAAARILAPATIRKTGGAAAS